VTRREAELSWYRTAFGAHYRLLYRHRDQQEAARCLSTVARLAPLGRGPVLDLACGEGRHLSWLAETGLPAVGLDLSADLLAAARAGTGNLDGIWLVRADMRCVPLHDASVSAVLSLFTSFGYFGPLERHGSVVREIARLLPAGGHWFLDYLNCRAVQRNLGTGPSESCDRIEPFEVQQRRRLGQGPLRVIKLVSVRPLPGRQTEAARWNVPVDGLHYQEEVVLFSLAEIDALAERCHLERVAQAGSYQGDPLDEETSPRWLLVYRKRRAA